MARINIKRAVALLVTGQAEPLVFISQTAWQVRSPNLVLEVPEHIRMKDGNTERLWKVPPVSRREVLRRDHHACQYCGSAKNLTIDHIQPRSKGGTHTWDNVVAACERCNAMKSDRTLTEVHLSLKSQPKAPAHPAVMFAEQFWKTQQYEC